MKNGDLISIATLMAITFQLTNPHFNHNQAT